MKKELTVSVIFLVALGFVSGVAAQTTSDDADINVTVGQQVAVDLTPSLLEYLGVEPGNLYTETDNAFGYTGVEIRNIGSVNLSEIWLETTTPGTNPFGTGVASNYNAGNFVVVNDSEDSYRSFVNRKEFSEPGDGLNFINKPDDSWSEGRLAQGGDEYFYVVDASNGVCNGSQSHEIRVGNVLHNDTQTGTTDFVNGDYSSYTLSTSTPGYGVVPNLEVGDRNYTVMTECSGSAPNPESVIYRTRYNPELNGASLDTLNGAAEYLTTGLLPGQTYGLGVALQVPLGVAEGQLENGLLTVNARQ